MTEVRDPTPVSQCPGHQDTSDHGAVLSPKAVVPADKLNVPAWTPPGLDVLLSSHPRYRKLISEAFWAGARHGRPVVTVNPAMRSGAPCVNGTRVPVESIACAVWLDGGVDAAMADYDLTRHDVLVACWFAGTYGLPGRRLALTLTATWRRRWGVWADGVHDRLWSHRRVDIETIEGPPTLADQQEKDTAASRG